MRKAGAAWLAVLLALCLTACGAAGRAVSQSDEVLTRDETMAGEGANQANDSPDRSEQAASEPVKLKIGLLGEMGQGEDSFFNQSAWSGLEKAEQEMGIAVKRLDSRTEAEYGANLEDFARERYDLVIVSGRDMTEALAEAAGKHPKLQIAVLDWWAETAAISGNDHMAVIRFDPVSAAYLAGIAAGMMTKTDQVGWIVGAGNERTAAAGYGYLAGVLDANPDAVILQMNVHSFSDQEQGRAAACQMAEEGADVLFHEAGSCGLGVIQGCQERQILAIGMDYDQSASAPEFVAASVVKQLEQAVLDVSRSCAEGKLESGILTYDLRNEGCDFLPAGDILPEEVLTALQTVKEQLMEGQIMVPNTREEFEAAYGDVYLLD
ncbi:MAG: BMP family ABC transporter substrate-binding protein [Lachnospiraceae bacterium]|nr:BMP family ABC transporter substrate-binding protein [Lachnospiraceae bacterium]